MSGIIEYVLKIWKSSKCTLEYISLRWISMVVNCTFPSESFSLDRTTVNTPSYWSYAPFHSLLIWAFFDNYMTGLQYSGKRDKERETKRETECVFSHYVTDFRHFYFILFQLRILWLYCSMNLIPGNPLSRVTNTIIRSIPFSSIICSK